MGGRVSGSKDPSTRPEGSAPPIVWDLSPSRFLHISGVRVVIIGLPIAFKELLSEGSQHRTLHLSATTCEDYSSRCICFCDQADGYPEPLVNQGHRCPLHFLHTRVVESQPQWTLSPNTSGENKRALPPTVNNVLFTNGDITTL